MGLLCWIRRKLGQEDEVFIEIPLAHTKGHLYASPMPFGPYDKYNQVLRRYREIGIEFAVSLVTDEEIRRKAKRDLLKAYERAGIESVRFPIRDLTSPELGAIRHLVRKIGPYLRAGAKVAVHCNAGTGRTGVVTACIVAALMDMDGPSAIRYVQDRMATQITSSQKRVVEQFAADPQVPL